MHLDLLDINLTIFYQWLMFASALLIIYYFYFKPITRVLDERKARTSQTLDGSILAGVKEAEEKYTILLKKIRGEGAEMRRELRTAAVAQEHEILEGAHSVAMRELVVRRSGLTAELEAARNALFEELPAMTKALVKRLLGREVN